MQLVQRVPKSLLELSIQWPPIAVDLHKKVFFWRSSIMHAFKFNCILYSRILVGHAEVASTWERVRLKIEDPPKCWPGVWLPFENHPQTSPQATHTPTKKNNNTNHRKTKLPAKVPLKKRTAHRHTCILFSWALNLRASWKRSRMRRAPTPTNISSNSEPEASARPRDGSPWTVMSATCSKPGRNRLVSHLLKTR